jgi:hypothetical protein
MANNKSTKRKGLAVDATNPDNTKRKIKFTDNSTFNQRLKMLDWLFEKISITTSMARERLDIMHPAGRIKELRKAGYQIATIWDSWISEHGIKHRIARYVLTRKEPLETINDCEVM